MQKFNAFDAMNGGNARLYPLTKEQRKTRWENIKDKDWATPDHVPHFDGFLKIDQSFINELQTAFISHGGPFRFNLDATKKLNDDGQFKQFDIRGWIPNAASASTKSAAPAQPKEEFEDDIPF